MKLPKEEKERYQAAFREMSLAKKLDYIFTYYRLTLSIIAIVLVFICAVLYIRLTSKDIPLYVGLVNVEAGDVLQSRLTDDYLVESGRNPKEEMVQLYQGLYLTSDPASEAFQYVYASRLKVMASIESHELDVLLMNQEAYDSFSQSGYLLQLGDIFDESDGLTTNLVIYEDNAAESAYDDTIAYEAVTGEEDNGLNCSGYAFYQEAGFTEPLYLGIVANTERTDTAVEYLRYLK